MRQCKIAALILIKQIDDQMGRLHLEDSGLADETMKPRITAIIDPMLYDAAKFSIIFDPERDQSCSDSSSAEPRLWRHAGECCPAPHPVFTAGPAIT